MAKVMLFGLSGDTSDQLTRVLEAHQHTIVPQAESAGGSEADAIFCSGDNLTPAGVQQVVETHAAVPVIVVTGCSAAGTWLDAMEHGVADYCSEPLEESEVLWTLATAMDTLR
jgi:AmiR/NasT family two-component response regulator